MEFPAADRHSYELRIFHDVAKALTSSLDLDTILQTIMDKTLAAATDRMSLKGIRLELF